MQTFLAKTISRVLGPLSVLPIVDIWLLLLYAAVPKNNQWGLFILLVLTYVLVPIGVMMVYKFFGRISDWDITSHKERWPVFTLIAIINWIGVIIMTCISGSELFNYLMISVAVSFTLIYIFNFRTKISLHAGGITITYFLVNILLNWQYWYLFVLIGIVCWARLTLKKHTLGQLILGITVPTIVFLTLISVVLE